MYEAGGEMTQDASKDNDQTEEGEKDSQITFSHLKELISLGRNLFDSLDTIIEQKLTHQNPIPSTG